MSRVTLEWLHLYKLVPEKSGNPVKEQISQILVKLSIAVHQIENIV